MGMVFAARELREKSCEQQRPLYMAFLDLMKTLDSINRQALRKALEKYGCLQRLITIVCLPHDDMQTTILCNEEVTKFSINLRT